MRNNDLAAIDIAEFAHPCEEAFDTVCRIRLGAQTTDSWHCWFLGARGTSLEDSPAENAEEMSPPHVRPLPQETAPYQLKRLRARPPPTKPHCASTSPQIIGGVFDDLESKSVC